MIRNNASVENILKNYMQSHTHKTEDRRRVRNNAHEHIINSIYNT